jgi:hypothetical protein
MEKISTLKKTDKRYAIALVIIILLGSAWMLFNGIRSTKTFIDEYWSYSIANSDDAMILYGKYKDTWVSAETLRNYLTVQKDERFSYNRLKNYIAENESHPPLFYFALHTVCSFFPDTFSKWYGLGINFVFFIGICIALYFLALLLFNSPARAVVTVAVWVFSMGALNTFLLIRMYCMLTFFITLALYCTVRYFFERKNSDLVWMFIIFVLGGLTEFVFWPLGFFITVVFFVMTIKSPKVWFAYGITALAAFAATCIIFPVTFYHLFGATGFIADRNVIGGSVLLNPAEVFNRFMVDCKDRFFPIVVSKKFIFFTGLLALLALAVNTGLLSFKEFPAKLKTWIRETFTVGKRHNIAMLMVFFVYGLSAYFLEAVHLWPYSWHATRFVFVLYPMQAVFVSLGLLFVYRQIKNLKLVPKLGMIGLMGINLLLFNNTFSDKQPPVSAAYNWFIHEDARNYEQFNGLIKDAHVFYIRRNWNDCYLFNSMPRYFESVKEILPMQREDNGVGYDYQRDILGQLSLIPAGEKTVIMNLNEEGGYTLSNDSQFISRLNNLGLDIITLKTDIDIGHYNRFNPYGIVPYPDTAALLKERIQNERDIVKYLKFISDSRYSVLISVMDEAAVNMNDTIMSGLQALGFEQDLRGKIQHSYIAVIDGGQVVCETLAADRESALSQSGTLKDGTPFEILSAGYHVGNTCSIVLNDGEYAVRRRGLNFVIYDNEDKKVIDSVAFDTWSAGLEAHRK